VNVIKNVTLRAPHRIAWTCLIVLCLIGAAASLRRMVALVSPPQSVPAQLAQLAALDAHFAKEKLLTFGHIAPALALVAILPFQFSGRFRNRHLRIHRILGRIAMVLGFVIATSGFALLLHPVGGAVEIAAIVCFGGFFFYALTRAWTHARRRQIDSHREWVIRAMSVALGVATVRPVMGIFFALSRGTARTPAEFFGPAFWIGFSLTLIAAEIWVRATRLPKIRATA
jgi:uncharacterized membrane protein